ncbi:MAG TPA: SDR family NAD(P)-dependent oxidoreductase [Dehalococcoidia bacterium]|nr:SDR family NAD(P)-dependent oxidoreductase [Dehalococcoidia bacterium]
MDIGGTVAVVTGAGSGIGRAMAVALANEGARAVVIADLDETGAEQTVEQVRAAGSRAAFVRVDVTDAAAMRELLDEAQMQFTRLDVLCNNAGVGEPPAGLFDEDGDLDAFERVVAVNLTAVIRGTQLGVLKMRELGRGGVIVNTASMGGLRPMPTSPVYAATKAGVIHFTRSLRHLYEEANIRVNAICPSFVDTPLVHRDGPERLAALAGDATLLVPELVAQGLIELVTDDSRAGAVMRVTAQKGIDYARDIAP